MASFTKPAAQSPNAQDMHSGEILKRLIGMINEMVVLMNEEETLITARKIKEHAELLKQKQQLTISYRAHLKAIALQPNILRQMPQDLRQSARKAAQKLADISERNARFLRGAIIASEKLAESVIQIVKDECLPKGGYVNPHSAAFKLGTYSPLCKPVTVNRTA